MQYYFRDTIISWKGVKLRWRETCGLAMSSIRMNNNWNCSIYDGKTDMFVASSHPERVQRRPLCDAVASVLTCWFCNQLAHGASKWKVWAINHSQTIQSAFSLQAMCLQYLQLSLDMQELFPTQNRDGSPSQIWQAERSTSNKFSISDRIQESTHQGNRTTIAYVRLSLEKCCFNGKKNCAWKLLSWEMWRWTCRELVVSMMPLSSLVGLLDIEMI